MIIVDLNQIMISNLMVQINGRNAVELSEDLVRHMVLNSLRGHYKRFRDYGEMIIACDSGNVWRREVFPNYKASRKTTREKSGHDWTAIFEILNNIRSELKEHMPYKVVEVDTAEADDIIAALVKKYTNQKILILSGDKDFIQLHRNQLTPSNNHVKQYNPVLNKFVGKGETPSIYIKEHILKGDRSDGIPNVLSDDDVFVEGRRQRPLTKKKISSWLDEMVMTFTEEEQKNYDRNRKLIDLSLIPPELEAKIYNEFDEVKVAHRSKILNYFITRKLKTLIEVIDEF
jgi:hypothetical protein